MKILVDENIPPALWLVPHMLESNNDWHSSLALACSFADLLPPRQSDRGRFCNVHDLCTRNQMHKRWRNLIAEVAAHLRIHGPRSC
jgi:hypothetical protein